MRRFNLFGGELELDEDDPDGYRGGQARISALLGARELVVKQFEIPPGKSLCPYHYEYVEEWLVVLDGAPTVRHPGGEESLAPGDVVCFPAGPEGAHKVTNPGQQDVRLLMFSDARQPSVAVYPDSDKIGIRPGRDEDRLMVRRSAGVDYWDGEA
jgi:uncharacterized cupin superfamily protein